MNRVGWLLLLAFASSTSAAGNISDYRLPGDLNLPEIRLSIAPDPAAGTFSAAALLILSPVTETVPCVILNAHKLDIDYASLRLWDPSTADYLALDRLVLDERLQRLALFPSKPLRRGVNYELSLTYNGSISDDGTGLYRTRYLDSTGNSRWMSVTQLRPVFARRLFPCLDEPSYKSIFQLRVWHPVDEFVISNTKPVATERDGQFAVTSFEKTPLLPAFLVAFIVSRLECVSTGAFSSYAVYGKEAGAAYAAEIGPQMAQAMEHHLSIPYPLPKTDQVALPQLVPVAMENWALYNYREGNILYFPQTDKTVQKQTAARFSGHEITHAWMGNAVTLGWWDWLWLSEMFAMYYEYYLPGVVNPTWRMMDQMVVDLTQLGLDMDSRLSSPPLTTTLMTPEEIVAKFGGITYFKGPSLVRMVSHVLSEKSYVAGFSKFLQENWWGSVEPVDLWTTLERSSKTRLPASLTEIMATWTDKAGYPVVTVSRDYSSDKVYLNQRRFLSDEEEVAGANETWWIPLSVASPTSPGDTAPAVWFPPQQNLRLPLPIPTDHWIIVNTGGTGFFRVNYDERNWRKIIGALYRRPGRVEPVVRAVLVDDALALARAGQLAHAVALDLAKYLSGELAYVPWAAALKDSSLGYYRDILAGSRLNEHFKTYMLSIVEEIYTTIGFEEKPSDNHLEKLTREIIVEWACRMGNKDCLYKSSRYLNDVMRGVNPRISVDVVDTALCYGIAVGGEKEFLYVLSLYDRATDDRKPKYLNALACTTKPPLASIFLVNSIDEMSAENWGTRFSAFAARSENANFLLDLLLNNQEKLDNRFGSTSFNSFLTQIAAFLQTPEHSRKMSQLDKSGVSGVGPLATVTKRVRWLERHGSHLRDYFLQSALIFSQ